MQPPIISDEDHVDQHLAAASQPLVPAHLVVAAITTTIVALLILAEIAGQPLTPPSVRQLAIGALVGVWSCWYVRRAEERSNSRLDAIERRLDTRMHDACCAEAYVDGLARRPLGGDGRHLHSA